MADGKDYDECDLNGEAREAGRPTWGLDKNTTFRESYPKEIDDFFLPRIAIKLRLIQVESRGIKIQTNGILLERFNFQ